jgi:hypothetical protein
LPLIGGFRNGENWDGLLGGFREVEREKEIVNWKNR